MSLNGDTKGMIEASLHIAKAERDAAIMKVERFQKMLDEGFKESEEDDKDEGGAKKKRKMTPKLDANGNKIAKKMSAYHAFLREKLKESKDAGKSSSFADIAELWKNVDGEEKAHYETLAKKANDKATEERLALGSATAQDEAPATPVAEVVTAIEGSAVKIPKSEKSEKKKKKKKDKKARKESIGSEATFDS